ncbi:hypothetical protein B0H11DRAFT_2113041 [Mycena galericulata]|nr:hypothetical protein B0H11DRAFT_2113041 [Mycena galericulata]
MPSIHPTAMTQTDESRVNKPRDASRFGVVKSNPFKITTYLFQTPPIPRRLPTRQSGLQSIPFSHWVARRSSLPEQDQVLLSREVHNDGSDGLAGALSSNPSGVRSGQQFSQVGAGVFRLDAQTLATRYRTPAITYWDESFVLRVMSAVREYRGNLYVTSVGTGTDLRLATIVHPGPASIQEVTKEFYEQTRDPSFGRTVDGHRRFIPGIALRSRWQSRFKVTQIRCGGVNFDWIWAPDNDIWLPFHQQMKLIMDHNCANPNVNFVRLIGVLTPLMEEAMKNLLVEYVYAILAVMHKLPTNEERKGYLMHQRTHFIGLATVEYSMDGVHSPERRYEIFQQAYPYPGVEQLAAARALGLTASLWELEPYQHIAAFHGQPQSISAHAQIRMAHSSRYMEQINPIWTAVAKAIYPVLKLKTMETEYALYANATRLRVEELETVGQLANLPDLSAELAALPFVKVH